MAVSAPPNSMVKPSGQPDGTTFISLIEEGLRRKNSG